MEWIKKGTKWFDPSSKTNDWDFSSHLKKIPEEYIKTPLNERSFTFTMQQYF
ncbi:hypothetical protein [Chryseobacterium paludis]|uniref:hypothetical protein n=1 Tax=Chryseobacterium paludis TaxID=2956784 RepID=UPI0021C005DB|nr:hypothetical protein [Chryseobacterium paludis]